MSGRLSWAIVEPSANSTIECTTDWGWTTTSIRSYGRAEQLVGLDDFEALVHQRARVHRDLRPHRPRRVRQRVRDRDVGEAGGAAAPKRATARRQQQASDLALGVNRRAQALVDRAVLRVDGDQLGAGDRSQRLHNRAGGDEALLVGERQTLAGRERCDRHRQPGETNDAVDHHVGGVDQLAELAHDRGERERRSDLRPTCRVGDGDDLGPELDGLFDQRVHRRPDAEPDDLVAPGLGPHDVEGLRADRPRRSGDGDAGRVHARVPASSPARS